MKNLYKRFKININIDEAQYKFINRIINSLFYGTIFIRGAYKPDSVFDINDSDFRWQFCNKLGIGYKSYHTFKDLLETKDFNLFLVQIQALLDLFKEEGHTKQYNSLSNLLQYAINEAELDLGIRIMQSRKNGFQLLHKGARILDEKLVNDVLDWLDEENLESVKDPYSDSLESYLKSKKDKKELRNAVNNSYLALENFAKVVCSKKTNLSKNKGEFIKTLNLNKYHGNMLSAYIEYANEFSRHTKKTTAKLDENEVESFIYLTGLFIRLGMKSK